MSTQPPKGDLGRTFPAVGQTLLGAPSDLVSEDEAARILATRYGFDYVDVASFAPDPEILKSVPVELMFRYSFLPYHRLNGKLVLVMADPTDIPMRDDGISRASSRARSRLATLTR